MRVLHNASLATKLLSLTLIAMCAASVLGYGSVRTARVMGAQANHLIREKLRPAQWIGDIRGAVGSLRSQYSAVSMQQDGAAAAATMERTEITSQTNTINEKLASLHGVSFVGDQADALNEADKYWEQYQQLARKFWTDYDQGGAQGVPAFMYTSVDRQLGLLDTVLRRLTKGAEQGVVDAEAALDKLQRSALTEAVAVAVGTLLLLLFLSWLLVRSLTGHVKLLTAVAQEMARGNLQRTLEPSRRKDELGRLHDSMARMSTYVKSLLVEVTQSGQAVADAADSMLENAEQVGRSAVQLAGAMEQVASGAAGQNTAVQDTSKIMEQMREAIEQVTRGAQDQAAHVGETTRLTAQAGETVRAMAQRVENLAAGAEASSAAAETGIEVVTRAVASIDRLSERVERATAAVQELEAESRQIGQAVTLITEIADQTNLLALNAAIEAARAGESGRGFAVVAEEVRRLAERSGKSASEISQLIQSVERRTAAVASAMREGQAEARQSGALAGDAGQALRSIIDTVRSTASDIESMRSAAGAVSRATQTAVSAVEQIAAVVEENTATTEEMAASSDHVSQAVSGIAEVAGQTAATAEEVTASVEELTAATEQVTETARSLVAVSQHLREQVRRFQV